VPDREDAAVDRVKPPEGDAVIDGSMPEAKSHQLPPRDHTVLPLRELGNQGVSGSSGTFAPYFGANVPLDAHARIVAARA
jgi:hypothetical protein